MCIIATVNSLILSLVSYHLVFTLCFSHLVKCTDSIYHGNPKFLTIRRNDFETEHEKFDNVQKELSTNHKDRRDNFDEFAEIVKLLRSKKSYPIDEDEKRQRFAEIPKLSTQDEETFQKQTSSIRKYFSQRRRSNTLKRRLARIFAFPYVKVIINGRSIIKDLYHSITVTYEPDMSTFRALKMAALKSYRKSRNIENPFNIKIIWNDELGCEVIQAAAGQSNTYAKKWKIRILRKRGGKRIYSGECIPSEDLRISPGTRIVLKYARN